jgi:hypothetical protein
MQKLVIFHSDDFNLTMGVNRGILEAHTVGVVKSTSIMINLPGADESVSLLKKQPSLDAGLHVNLTFGKPVLDAAQVPTLVDDGGIFWRNPNLLLEFADFEEMKEEITAQMELAARMGLHLTHMDSHHHIHQFDSRVHLFMVGLAKRHRLAVRSVDDKMREICRKNGVPTTDNFSADFYGQDNVSLEKLEEIVKLLPSGTTELMCHPGQDDKELCEKSSYDHPRLMEVKTLTSPGTLQLLQKHQVKIIGFVDLLDFFPGYEKKT